MDWYSRKPSLDPSDPQHTEEWKDSIRQVIEKLGSHEAERILLETLAEANKNGIQIRPVSTPYLNTIHPDGQPTYPGNLSVESRIHGILRWNAMMMVTKANKENDGIGGHISTYASVSTLWEVGMNHHFKGKQGGNTIGDHVYFQGHASPGIYARAWLEGRLSKEQINNFRQEVKNLGLSSYPHPRLMPDFWEFPTVSMGLGPMSAIHHARFNRYLSDRGMADTAESTVWYTMGDGESDEPESLSEIALAAREGLDNLVFIINCNLQRLDGPVRGNGKIVQELEGRFSGVGWNVIKLLWGSKWDQLFSHQNGKYLAERLNELVDGDEQRILTGDATTIRNELFNSNELSEMIEGWSDADLLSLTENLGGHDMEKIHAAFSSARANKGSPTVILARTIKGYGLGPGFAGRNTTHQKKKADIDAMIHMREMIGLEFTNEELESYPFVEPGMMPEVEEYMKERRQKLGGPIPERIDSGKSIIVDSKIFTEFDQGTKGTLEVSTTMAFVKILRGIMKNKDMGSQVVLIIPDEARTFGMDPLFAEFGIYHPEGQLYKPVDHKTLMKYKVSNEGQIIQAGINEAGAMSTFIASAMSYATANIPTIPFYTFYSMFGFQRVADLIWAAADGRARGFLMGATSGRTTLNGEGLQHQDGHSLLMAHTNPAVKAWDPAFAYEIAAIIKHGINEMYVKNKDVINYIALYNENYSMPEIPEGVDEKDILSGMYHYKTFQPNEEDLIEITVELLGSGPIMQQVLRAAEILVEKGIACRVWSVTSYGELYREAAELERLDRLSPQLEEGSIAHGVEKIMRPRIFNSRIYQSLGDTDVMNNPLVPEDWVCVAASDNIRAVPELIRPWVPQGKFIVLGTDGFGRSDTRSSLRRFFEVDAEHIALAAISGLADATGSAKDWAMFESAKKEFGIDVEREDIASL